MSAVSGRATLGTCRRASTCRHLRSETVTRKLGAVVLVAMTLMLAGCTSSTTPPKSSTASTRPSHTTTTTVNRADLERFVAPAQQGLRESFEAAYQVVYPPGAGASGFDFRIWSERAVGSDAEGNFVYEAPFDHGTFRFIQHGRDDYQCLEPAPQTAWKCTGPLHAVFNEQQMQVEEYRYPMWITGQMTLGLATPLSFSHRSVLGHSVWCVNIESESLICLTKTGQLGLDASLGGSYEQVELVSLTLASSKSAFLLPARPTLAKNEILSDRCGTSYCPSPGL